MKNLLFLLYILISLAGFAQIRTNDSTTTNIQHKESNDFIYKASSIETQDSVEVLQTSIKYTNMIELSYYIKNSKLHQYKNGQLRALKMIVKLKNDATISTTGLIKMNNGQTLQLKNGDSVDKNGIITKFKK